MFPAASLRLFGRRSFAAIHGILYGALGIGAALGAWLGGWLRDVSGSYSSAVLFVAGSLVLSAIAYGLADSRQNPRNRKKVVRAVLGGPECNTN
jgi:predicted MFS family arabinose efflux permease